MWRKQIGDRSKPRVAPTMAKGGRIRKRDMTGLLKVSGACPFE
jgi:hypothetical protein